MIADDALRPLRHTDTGKYRAEDFKHATTVSLDKRDGNSQYYSRLINSSLRGDWGGRPRGQAASGAAAIRPFKYVQTGAATDTPTRSGAQAAGLPWPRT